MKETGTLNAVWTTPEILPPTRDDGRRRPALDGTSVLSADISLALVERCSAKFNIGAKISEFAKIVTAE